MTLAEFKFILTEDAGILSSGNLVVALFNQYPGSITRIDAIALRITENHPLIALQNATLLSIQDTVSGSLYYLPVVSSLNPVRTVDKEVVENYFLYSISPENQRLIIENPTLNSDGVYNFVGDVIVEPINSPVSFLYNDYNILIGNVQESRSSQYISVSDRAASSLSPINLSSILADVAIKATIQDSNYSSTGWVNARYNGTRLTSLGNHGADPFLQGTFFEGAFFGKDVDDLYISEIAPSDLDIKQYFFSGKLNSLRYTLEDMKTVTTVTYDTSATEIDFLTTVAIGGSLTPKTVHIGELFIVNKYINPTTYQFSTEILQMMAPTGSQQYFPYSDYFTDPTYTAFTMRMKRRYNETKVDSANSNSILYRIVPTKVYSLVGNFAQPVQEGKLRVKGTTEVIYLDSDGFVISGSSVDFI